MTYIAIQPGAFSRAEHELAAIIDVESAILQVLSLWSISRPVSIQRRSSMFTVQLTTSFDADER